MRGHAEIAGGGIGGLVLGMMLVRRGWTARVHERSDEIREIGAGIYIKNNSIRVLEEFGVFGNLGPRGMRLDRAEARNARGELVLTRPHDSEATRVYVFSRQALIEELRDAALAAGVDVGTSSPVAGADASGVLILEDGTRCRADVVVGCDGFNSKVRDSLAVGARPRLLDTNINRYLVPHRRYTHEAVTTEHYAGRCRVGVTPAGEALSYIFTVSPHHDERARALPIDSALWSQMYPHLAPMFEELATLPATSFQYCLVRTPHWHKGRVALVGDAATGMPPTLGQGAGLTIMNARTLVEALDRARSVEAALAAWEGAVRHVSDLTQNWALRWDWISRTCPPWLAWWLKPTFLGTMRALPAINRRMRIADRGLDIILPGVRAALPG